MFGRFDLAALCGCRTLNFCFCLSAYGAIYRRDSQTCAAGFLRLWHELGWRLHDPASSQDGSCLFHALYAYGLGSSPATIRLEIVDFICKHWEQYKQVGIGASTGVAFETAAQYRTRMSCETATDRTNWAGLRELTALSAMANVQFSVYSSSSGVFTHVDSKAHSETCAKHGMCVVNEGMRTQYCVWLNDAQHYICLLPSHVEAPFHCSPCPSLVIRL